MPRTSANWGKVYEHDHILDTKHTQRQRGAKFGNMPMEGIDFVVCPTRSFHTSSMNYGFPWTDSLSTLDNISTMVLVRPSRHLTPPLLPKHYESRQRRKVTCQRFFSEIKQKKRKRNTCGKGRELHYRIWKLRNSTRLFNCLPFTLDIYTII